MERLVFTHIGKTGGSSVNGLLFTVMSQCGANTLAFSGSCTQYADPDRPSALMRQHDIDPADFSIIIGHIPFATAVRCFAPARFVTVLRHPAWQLISSYCSQPTNKRLADFGISRLESRLRFRWRFDPRYRRYAEWAIDNIQTRMLCDTPRFGEQVTPEMLESAKRNLQQRYTLVGFQTDLGAFLLNVAAHYGLSIEPGTMTRVNGTGAYQDMVSKRHLEIAERHSKIDMELYEWAREAFAETGSVEPIAALRAGVPYRKISIGPDHFEVNCQGEGFIAA